MWWVHGYKHRLVFGGGHGVIGQINLLESRRRNRSGSSSENSIASGTSDGASTFNDDIHEGEDVRQWIKKRPLGVRKPYHDFDLGSVVCIEIGEV